MAYWDINHNVNLDQPYKGVSHMEDVLLVPGGENGHRWRVTVINADGPVDLTGWSVYAKFQRVNGGSWMQVEGDAAGNVAEVVFNELCYSVPGVMRGVFYIESGQQILPLIEAYFNVRETFGGNMALTVDQIMYMPAQNIVRYNGIDYRAVSGTTAVQGDVRDGKTFYLPDGTEGTGDADFEVTLTGGTVTETLISGDDYELTISEA